MRHALSVAALLGILMTEDRVEASSFCISPRAPTLFANKPSKPVCFNGCEQYEIDSYKRDVQRYFADLNQYLEDVERYRKQAYEYAKCMADLS